MAELRLTTLVENCVYKQGLHSEHGLSLFIEFNDVRLLFDTGQSSIFIDNSTNMKINLKNLDCSILSHGHYDHTGGLKSLLELNPKLKVFTGQHFLRPKFNITGKENGIPNIKEINKTTFEEIGKPTEIFKDIYLFPAAPIHYKEDFYNKGLFIKSDGKMVSDQFVEELTLVIVKDKKLTIISGCSHRGITNIVKHIYDYFKLPIALITGGFHLKNENKETVSKVVKSLNSYNIEKISVSHCTGLGPYCQITKESESDVSYNFTGNCITI